MVAAAKTSNLSPTAHASELHRVIGWKDAFWVASGVPALVLFSIGGIAATVGTPSVLVWTLSVLFGFIQAFTYAEIAGLFPNKSGGASVYGAAAVALFQVHRALSVWCNWLAWTPVLASAVASRRGTFSMPCLRPTRPSGLGRSNSSISAS